MCCCCLCRRPFDASSAKKRKLLYNDGCTKARKFFNEVLHNKLRLSLNSFLETSLASSPPGFLCDKCDQAKSYFMHKEELQKIEQRVVGYVSSLTRLNQDVPGSNVTQSSSIAGVNQDPSSRNATEIQTSRETSRLSSRSKRRRLMPASNEDQSSQAPTPSSHSSMPPPPRPTPSVIPVPSTPPSSAQANRRDISPAVTVLLDYETYLREFEIDSPTDRRAVKQVSREEYPSAVKTMQKKVNPEQLVAEPVKIVMAEIEKLCSTKDPSAFRDTNETMKNFSWESLWSELASKAPTLLHLFRKLFRGASKALICFAISLILKYRSPKKMGAVQRAISTCMYGNGANKQLYNCLQPLMVCLSYNGTIKHISSLTGKFDDTVVKWCDRLTHDVQGCIERRTVKISWAGTNDADDEDADDVDSDEENGESNNDVSEEPTEEGQEDENDEQSTEQDIESNIEDFRIDIDPIDCLPPEHQTVDLPAAWSGFKIVGDNIDKNLRQSYQRCDRQTASLHYFHSCAVRDRIDFSQLSDVAPDSVVIDPAIILPNSDDFDAIKKEFQVLVSRILVQHISSLAPFKRSVEWHISSKYSEEMSTKSNVVPLGVLLFNENKTDEMCSIMKSLQKYVPKKTYQVTYHLSEENEFVVNEQCYHRTLFGGDQLTVCRSRGAQSARCADDVSDERFDGLVPVTEDWHARMTLMRAIWKHLFSSKSSSERGTLYQLKNLLHRTGVPTDPGGNMKAAEDFLLVVLHAHVIAAANTILSGAEANDVTELAKSIVERFVQFNLPSCSSVPVDCTDKVYLYATEVLTLGLLWHNFHDSTREGDGDRILRCWKFNLLLYKASQRKNYSIEALNLILQVNYTLSPREAAQVKWCRTVNTTNRKGHNIPMDLHLEHLNRRLKTTLRNMGSNVTNRSVKLAAESVGTVNEICHVFERQCSNSKETSDKHNCPSFEKDFRLILNTLEEKEVFIPKTGRQHNTFKTLPRLLEKPKYDNLIAWIKRTTKTLFE